ncbi:MAG: PLP-dependent transferase [Armatimonadetes bacterium]|nr:MAG: PLP-dependent transferase [Armatimonadota bacterium]
MDPFTQAIHADKVIDDGVDVAPPIRPSTTFLEDTGRRYRRTSHATTERFEAVLGALEGGHAVCYSTGMAAAAAAINYFRPKQIALPPVYHGVRMLVESHVEDGDLVLSEVDDLGEGDMEWIETPSNPKCLVTDIAAAASRNRERGVLTLVDSTFATPVLMHPLALGADIVMHSVTKAIGGHSDAHAGALIVADQLVADGLATRRNHTGAVPGSLDIWLALRGIRTLPLRVQRATATAMRLAQWAHANGIMTYYPGLESHPNHDVAVRQMSGFGSMMSIDVDTEERASRVVSGVELFTNATSLGGVESLIEHRLMSDPSVDPGLIRISVGLEDADDLIADLERAIANV